MSGPVSLPDGSEVLLPRGGPVQDEPIPRPDEPAFCRLAYAAAHLVMRESYSGVPHSVDRPGTGAEIAGHIDWDATMDIRRHLIDHGFGIAEAMDTAQRYEVGWPIAKELIERCGRLRSPVGFIAGAGTDQLSRVRAPADLVDAVVEQCAFISEAGGWPMILAMPWLTEQSCDEATFVDVYVSIIRQVDGPVFIHWLGPMFLSSLAGYFPGRSFGRIMHADPSKVRGCKLSMLDERLERRLRRELAAQDQIMLTGDDFHFGELMEGEPRRTTRVGDLEIGIGDLSHALLGVFDGIAAPASRALRALGSGDMEGYRELIRRCERFGQVVFEAPTERYKVGLAFIAWLNGYQSNHMLPNHLERERGTDHLCRVVHAAADCGAINDSPMTRELLETWTANARMTR